MVSYHLVMGFFTIRDYPKRLGPHLVIIWYLYGTIWNITIWKILIQKSINGQCSTAIHS
jgi:hypothetical protein